MCTRAHQHDRTIACVHTITETKAHAAVQTRLPARGIRRSRQKAGTITEAHCRPSGGRQATSRPVGRSQRHCRSVEKRPRAPHPAGWAPLISFGHKAQTCTGARLRCCTHAPVLMCSFDQRCFADRQCHAALGPDDSRSTRSTRSSRSRRSFQRLRSRRSSPVLARLIMAAKYPPAPRVK